MVISTLSLLLRSHIRTEFEFSAKIIIISITLESRLGSAAAALMELHHHPWIQRCTSAAASNPHVITLTCMLNSIILSFSACMLLRSPPCRSAVFTPACTRSSNSSLISEAFCQVFVGRIGWVTMEINPKHTETLPKVSQKEYRSPGSCGGCPLPAGRIVGVLTVVMNNHHFWFH